MTDRGTLRVYLGAAPGVGKTFTMLAEGHRRRARGTDVVIAAVDAHGRARTAEQIEGLERIPTIPAGDARDSGDVDVAAVLRRRPAVALVDELERPNRSGAPNPKRWQDVEMLLAVGIDVITTVNVEHLESLNDVVERITGVPQPETVPDVVVRAAEQVEIVDMAPEALRRRLAHGNVYPADQVDTTRAHFFRLGTLTALRELALMWLAGTVDDSLQAYLLDHGIAETWETRERVVVAVTGAPTSERLIRRAARMATRAHGELVAVHVRGGGEAAPEATIAMERNRQLVLDLGGTHHEVSGTDVGLALSQFARAEKATQVVLGATDRSRWAELLGRSVTASVLGELNDIDVHVMRHREPSTAPLLRRVGPRRSLSAARQRAGWAIVVVGLPVLTLALTHARSQLDLSGDLLVFLLLVVAAATAGGAGPAIVAAAGGALALNWYFTPPLHTYRIDKSENVLALLAFLVVGAVVALLVTRSARQRAEAERARAEAGALARLAAEVVVDDDPLPALLERLRETLGLDWAEVETDDEGAWHPVATVGDPDGSGHVHTTILGPGTRLVLRGPTPAAEDQRVLRAFAVQLGAALERRRLRAQADAAAVLSQGDALRTALLRAVSHDLRTPLASIKAAVTSLLQDDIDWPPYATSDFLHTIDEESDRLDGLVANLLDMTRLQTGALQVADARVGWAEVVSAAVASLSGPVDALAVRVAEDLPDLLADPGLLERAVANVLANALRYAPAASRVRVEAGTVGDEVHLRVIDQGPGIEARDRARLFDPFQRAGDQTGTGVGLGLAVARGFVEAMGGSLEAEDTPGGGLTMLMRMPTADGAADQHPQPMPVRSSA